MTPPLRLLGRVLPPTALLFAAAVAVRGQEPLAPVTSWRWQAESVLGAISSVPPVGRGAAIIAGA